MKQAWILMACASCANAPRLGPPENLALAAFAADVAEYPLRRVGVLPCAGPELAPAVGEELQALFAAELARRASFEVVIVGASDLIDLPGGDRRPGFPAESERIVALARRHDLDALFVLRARDRAVFAPQRLGLQAELVACETGSTLWTAQGAWNAADARVRTSLEAWFARERAATSSDEDWGLYLLSPTRFASYACAQIADRFAPLPPKPAPRRPPSSD